MDSKAFWVSLAAVVGAQGAAADTSYRTVSWFEHHPTERHAVIAWCQDNRGLSPRSPNCENAVSADNKQTVCTLVRDPPAYCLR